MSQQVDEEEEVDDLDEVEELVLDAAAAVEVVADWPLDPPFAVETACCDESGC